MQSRVIYTLIIASNKSVSMCRAVRDSKELLGHPCTPLSLTHPSLSQALTLFSFVSSVL